MEPTSAPKGFVDNAWEVQHRMERGWERLGKGRIARVLKMARKPEPEELRQSAFIVLVGIAVIGALGFFVYLLMSALVDAIRPI